jgi:hypothetical protein
MSVAKATPRSRNSQGCVYNLSLSTAAIENNFKANWVRHGVSR